MAINDVAGVG